jgi:hypothetical protein
MTERTSLAKLEPLFFGRLTRVGFGLATLYAVYSWWSELDWLWAAVLVFLGLSFLAGGLVGNPGCEITALPNLVLPKEKHAHCV